RVKRPDVFGSPLRAEAIDTERSHQSFLNIGANLGCGCHPRECGVEFPVVKSPKFFKASLESLSKHRIRSIRIIQIIKNLLAARLRNNDSKGQRSDQRTRNVCFNRSSLLDCIVAHLHDSSVGISFDRISYSLIRIFGIAWRGAQLGQRSRYTITITGGGVLRSVLLGVLQSVRIYSLSRTYESIGGAFAQVRKSCICICRVRDGALAVGKAKPTRHKHVGISFPLVQNKGDETLSSLIWHLIEHI